MWLKYEIGREKREHEFFVVSEMNRNIILGCDCVRHFGVQMYYDLGCIRVGKSYIKMEEDIHVSSIARAVSEIKTAPHMGKMLMCRAKGNPRVFKLRLHQFISTENSIVSQEPGLVPINSIVRINKSGKYPVFFMNHTNKTINIKKSNAMGKIEDVKQYNFIDIKAVMGNQLTEQKKISSFEELKEKTDASDSHQPIVQQVIRRNADLFAEKDTDFGRTDTIKMSIDTSDQPPIKFKPYRTPFAKRKIIDKAIDDMLAANIICPSRSP